MAEVFDIRKEEYLSLRKEVENDLKELSDLERNCVIAAATAYAWIATTATPSVPLVRAAWLLPIALPIYGAARSFAIGQHLHFVGKYIKGIESKHFPAAIDKPQDGWQHYFEANGRSVTTKIRKQFWFWFLALTAICSGLGYMDMDRMVVKTRSPQQQSSITFPAIRGADCKAP